MKLEKLQFQQKNSMVVSVSNKKFFVYFKHTVFVFLLQFIHQDQKIYSFQKKKKKIFFIFFILENINEI